MKTVSELIYFYASLIKEMAANDNDENEERINSRVAKFINLEGEILAKIFAIQNGEIKVDRSFVPRTLKLLAETHFFIQTTDDPLIGRLPMVLIQIWLIEFDAWEIERIIDRICEVGNDNKKRFLRILNDLYDLESDKEVTRSLNNMVTKHLLGYAEINALVEVYYNRSVNEYYVIDKRISNSSRDDMIKNIEKMSDAIDLLNIIPDLTPEEMEKCSEIKRNALSRIKHLMVSYHGDLWIKMFNKGGLIWPDIGKEPINSKVNESKIQSRFTNGKVYLADLLGINDTLFNRIDNIPDAKPRRERIYQILRAINFYTDTDLKSTVTRNMEKLYNDKEVRNGIYPDYITKSLKKNFPELTKHLGELGVE